MKSSPSKRKQSHVRAASSSDIALQKSVSHLPVGIPAVSSVRRVRVEVGTEGPKDLRVLCSTLSGAIGRTSL